MTPFDQQFRALQGAALVFARSVLHHRTDAEDAVQDAAIKAMSAYDTYDSSRLFKAWFFKILKNCCLDRLRQKSRAQAAMHVIGSEEDYDESLRQDQIEQVAQCLKQLKEEHQEILRLRYFGEMTYAELADCLNIPKGTVMSRLYTARLAFAKQMEINDE